MNASRSNLIVLHGILPDDFKRSAPIVAVHLYDDIPEKFTDVASWPEKTNLRCWHCDLLPEGRPAFVPVNPTRSPTGQLKCDTIGNFCEWNCAAAFVINHFPKQSIAEMLTSICWFEFVFTGNQRDKIIPSPQRTIMQAYCGRAGITQGEYKNRIKQINEIYNDVSSYFE